MYWDHILNLSHLVYIMKCMTFFKQFSSEKRWAELGMNGEGARPNGRNGSFGELPMVEASIVWMSRCDEFDFNHPGTYEIAVHFPTSISRLVFWNLIECSECSIRCSSYLVKSLCDFQSFLDINSIFLDRFSATFHANGWSWKDARYENRPRPIARTNCGTKM